MSHTIINSMCLDKENWHMDYSQRAAGLLGAYPDFSSTGCVTGHIT